MVLNLFIAVVVNAMQSQVSADLKDEGEAHTRAILDEVRPSGTRSSSCAGRDSRKGLDS